MYFEIKWGHTPEFSPAYFINIQFSDENANIIDHFSLSEANLDTEDEKLNQQRFKFETNKEFDLSLIYMSIYANQNTLSPCNNCDWNITEVLFLYNFYIKLKIKMVLKFVKN